MIAEVQKPKGSGTRQQRRVSVTRKKLLEAARAVFTERGFDLTRIDEITDRADVGKGTFYKHFKSKEQLINELIKGVLGELVAVIEARCSNPSDLKDFLEKLLDAHVDFFEKRWEDFVIYFQGRTDLTLQVSYSGIETPFLAYLERVEVLLASVLKYRLPKPVLRRVVCALAGFVSGYYSFAVISSQDEEIDKTFRPLRDAMVGSLARFIQETAPSGETNEAVGGVKTG